MLNFKHYIKIIKNANINYKDNLEVKPMKIKKWFTSILLGIITISILVGCSKAKDLKEPISKTELFMGTVITVTLYDKGSEAVLDKAFKRVEEIEKLVSINDGETEITKVNASAGKEPVKVSEDTYNIVKKGLDYSQKSNGSFDVSIGPLVKLWSIGLPEAKVPTNEEIQATLPLVEYTKVKLNDENQTIYLEEPGMMLDLGAVAKGYTADQIAEVLRQEGVESAIIDLGGNIFALGRKNNGKLWRVGIQDPSLERGEAIGIIEVENKSIVTSGIYERFIEKDGVKYHHILSPDLGYPYENEIAGVSIISDKSIDGDCLSTLVFSLGVEKGLEFVEAMPGVDAIFITKNKEVYTTSGIKDNFKISNSEYVIKN